MEINQKIIEPGENQTIKIPVGKLPSGNAISIQAHVFRGREKGPVMLALAGVHGDEINGVEIIRKAILNGYFDHLRRGTVIAIPLLNIFGFINFSRDVPDGKDVNRSFPGLSTGSLASRVAHTLTRKILPHIDFGVDFHTGGKSIYNFPQVRFSPGHAESEKLAKEFGAPAMIASKPIKKSLRQTALSNNKPIIVFEGGESTRLDGYAIECGLAGLQRIMANQGMTEEKFPAVKSQLFSKASWQRASHAGIFLWSKCSGNPVTKGEPIGTIGDPSGREIQTIYSRYNGLIIGHNNAPVVHQGDALFHIGI